MSRSALRWFLVSFYVQNLPIVSPDDSGCQVEICRYENGSYTITGRGTSRGPPKMKHITTHYDVGQNTEVGIKCQLCQSNPPSTLTWFFNGKPLDTNTNRIRKTTSSCSEVIHLSHIRLKDDGNYTCEARNSLGSANSTTTVGVIPDVLADRPAPLVMDIQLTKTERIGDAREVRIGSTVKITCTLQYYKCVTKSWRWKKDNEILSKKSPNQRIDTNLTQCTSQLTVKNVQANDTGDYTCIASIRQQKTEKHMSIKAVTCFRGYYCPSANSAAKLCPDGTYTFFKNATSSDHCQPCTTYDRNETLISMAAQRSKTAADIFRSNCLQSNTPGSHKSSRLSTSVKIALGLSVVVIFVVIIIGILFGLRRWRGYKRLIVDAHKNVEIEIPDIPRTNDVFVCYSSKNRKWVHEVLLANLKAQDFKTFIDFIDFDVGRPIHENMINGIYGSRKTVFVLSKDSLKSFFARTELHQALVARRQGRDHQVIVILFEKLKVPREISDVVYLDWTDEKNRDQFWEKLYRAIRRPLDGE